MVVWSFNDMCIDVCLNSEATTSDSQSLTWLIETMKSWNAKPFLSGSNLVILTLSDTLMSGPYTNLEITLSLAKLFRKPSDKNNTVDMCCGERVACILTLIKQCQNRFMTAILVCYNSSVQKVDNVLVWWQRSCFTGQSANPHLWSWALSVKQWDMKCISDVKWRAK